MAAFPQKTGMQDGGFARNERIAQPDNGLRTHQRDIHRRQKKSLRCVGYSPYAGLDR